MLPYDTPLAQPRTRSVSSAEPAKVIGWLLLAGWGVFSLVVYVQQPNSFSLVTGLVCLGLVAGFVQAHRHEGTTFSRLWVGFFTGAIVLAGVLVKVLSIVF